MKTEMTLAQIGEQAQTKGFYAKIKKGLIGPEILQLKREGITLMVKINSNNEVSITPFIPIWFQVLCIILVMILASIILTAIMDEAVIVKGGFVVFLVALLISSPIYKAMKRQKIDSAIEDVNKLL